MNDDNSVFLDDNLRVFLLSFAVGMADSYVRSAIENEVSHGQIHHPDFMEEKESKFYIQNADETLKKVVNQPQVEFATARTLVNGMIMTAHGNRSVQIRGILPVQEAKLTKLIKLSKTD